jgi:hypothetical protein
MTWKYHPLYMTCRPVVYGGLCVYMPSHVFTLSSALCLHALICSMSSRSHLLYIFKLSSALCLHALACFIVSNTHLLNACWRLPALCLLALACYVFGVCFIVHRHVLYTVRCMFDFHLPCCIPLRSAFDVHSTACGLCFGTSVPCALYPLIVTEPTVVPVTPFSGLSGVYRCLRRLRSCS